MMFRTKFSKKKNSIQAQLLALSTLFKQLPINFYWIDRQGALLGCNENLIDLTCLMLGEKKKVFGRHTAELLSMKVNQEAWGNSKEVMETGQEVVCEEEAIFPSGEKKIFLSIKSPLFDEKNNEVMGMVGIGVDISEQKRIQLELAQAKQTAEQANKAKTEFLANMSHDIRTPLAGMVGLTEYLYEQTQDRNLKAKAFQLMELSKNLLEVSNGLIEGSQAESGNLPIKSELFSLRKLLVSIQSLLAPNIRSRSIDFKIKHDKNLPDFLIGDERRIWRIVQNLVSNAIKFTEKGFIYVSVRLKSSHREKGFEILEIKVQDSGVGIPEDKQREIFERFSQLDADDEAKRQGFGIGLSIVEQFIKELKGTITVKSKEGQGSTFICNIPVKQPEAKTPNPLITIEEPIAPYKTSSLSKLKILVVEDNPLASFTVGYQLEKLNLKATWAESAERAIELYEKHLYDFVLTDLGLPNKDGRWLTEKIRAIERKYARQNQPPCIIVGLSAHVDKSLEKQCIDSGMNQILLKPITQQKLFEVLNHYFLSNDATAEERRSQKKADVSLVNNKVIDLERCAEKYYSNDIKTAEKMLRNLMDILPIEKQRIEEAFIQKNWDMLSHYLHNYCGSCFSCGAFRLGIAFKQFLDDLSKKRIENFQISYQNVMLEIQVLEAEFDKHLR